MSAVEEGLQETSSNDEVVTNGKRMSSVSGVSIVVDNDLHLKSNKIESPPNRIISSLNLPSNATYIRADITDSFSCEKKSYGYYADIANDCQVFHVCFPVTHVDGKETMYRWSFICPEETIFSQVNLLQLTSPSNFITY